MDKYKDTFDDKFETYKVYGRFYTRTGKNRIWGGGILEDFISRHKRFILKPVDMFGGSGIKIVQLSSAEDKEKLMREIEDMGRQYWRN